MDSLDTIEMAMQIEKTFDVDFTDALPGDLLTVGSLFDFIMRQRSPSDARPGRGPYYGQLWEKYLEIIEEGTLFARFAPSAHGRLTPATRFREDLFVDWSATL
jgi:hypothetical protein